MTGAVTALTRRLRGQVLLPGDPGYDQARRGYNLLHDRRPAVIVRPAGADDVTRALAFATGEGLEVAVRSGGHSLAGYGGTEGGLLLDLSAMQAIQIDLAAGTAWVEAGTTAGQLTAATAAHRRVVPFGDSPDVGVGGITLGGGVGWLSRKLGLTVDSVEGVELVAADGRALRVDDQRHPDLFWAIRGGGGNFGVVTRFRYRLHPIGPVLGGVLALPATGEVIRKLVELADAAPDELSAIMLVTRLPPLPVVPAEAHGRLAVLITLVWCGDLDAGERVVAAGFPEADADRHRRWVASLSDATRHLAKGAYLNFLDAADAARRHEAYPDPTYRRLAEAKRRYDPANLFHRNLNIRPAETSARR